MNINDIVAECLHEMAHLEQSAAERGAARLLLGKLAAVKGNRGRNRLSRAMKYLAGSTTA